MQIISCKNIEKSYFTKDKKTKVSVLKGIDLTVESGEMVALMGPSGVGKSTLLYLLGTLESPDSGEITINYLGKDYQFSKLKGKNLSFIRNEAIGFIFQFHYLLPEFSAVENITMPLLIKCETMKESKKRAIELLDFVGLADRADHKPSELSGGEQQRVAIARALINKPALLLADEPTGSLDHANSDIIINLLKSINTDFGITSIIATHSENISENCSRIIKMKDGLILPEII
jgi:lipoprotein-releasing system ATP-binding protein